MLIRFDTNQHGWLVCEATKSGVFGLLAKYPDQWGVLQNQVTGKEEFYVTLLGREKDIKGRYNGINCQRSHHVADYAKKSCMSFKEMLNDLPDGGVIA